MELQENQSNQPAKGINLTAHGYDDVEAKHPDGSEIVEDFDADTATAEPVNYAQIPCTPENFGVVPAEQFDDVYRQLIEADIEAAQANLDSLPENDRRGLTMETLRHFGCGFLPRWVLTKNRARYLCALDKDMHRVADLSKPNRLPPPSPRIIIPTSDRHFHATATDSARRSMDKDYRKQHGGKMDGEAFNVADALKHDLIVVVEGEIDAMSIWQSTQGAVGVVATLGCNNGRKSLLPYVDDLRGKKLLLLLDADEAGKNAAKKFLDEISELGLLAVNRTLYDAMHADYQKEFGNRPKDVDANSLLVHYSKPDPKFGNAYLRGLVERIIEDAEPDFDKRQKEIEEIIRERQEQAALPAPDLSALKVSSRASSSASKSSTENRRADVSKLPREEFDLILRDYVHARDLYRRDWLNVGRIMRDNGFTVEDFKRWSNDGDRRYNETTCEREWKDFHASADVNGKPVTVATLIYLAKQRGYQSKKTAWRPTNDESARADVASVFADNEDLRGRLSDWQELHGVIDPLFLPKIKEAAEYLDSLTVDDITADIAQSTKTVWGVALCAAYDLHDYAAKFFALIKEAKTAAKKRLQEDDAAELTAPLSVGERVQLSTLITGVDVHSLRNRITSTTNDFAKSQREYVKAEEQRKVREEAQRKQAARAVEMDDLRKRLETLKKQDQCKERDAAIRDTIRQLCKWKHDKLGNPVSVEANQANADLIFGSDPGIDGLVGYNEFSDANEFLKSPPWSKDTQRGDEFKDADEDRLAVFLRRAYTDFGNKELLSQNVTEISRVNQFNPVKEYFKNLPAWDGKERAETLFIDWLKVEDTPFVREITSKILLAAVARIFHPGCTFQNAVVLHGNQKIGKGYILERLGGQWYKAISDNVDDPHAVDAIRVAWLAEFKEMKGLSRAANDAIKEFIELPADTRRFAYERRARTVKRHCVFFLSVNDDEFLSDLTGNRRFWILHSPLPKFGWQPEVRGERLSDDNVVKQIWAEVYAKYQELFKDGFDERKLTLSREAEIAGEEIAEQYVRSDGGVEGIIRNFVDTKIPDSVIWSLLSREQRREFYVKGGMIALHKNDLLAKRRARGGRNEGDDVSKIDQLCTPGNQLGDSKLYAFYGTEYRQHICAAEVRDECFDKTDKRANPARIGEILKRLEGWTLGTTRYKKDFVYGDQKKVYWRNADNIPSDGAKSTDTEPRDMEEDPPF